MRKHHIAQLHADIACNDVLDSRLRQIVSDVAAQGPAHFSALVERFKTQPSPDAPPTNAPGQKSYDEMLLALLLTVWEEAKQAGVDKNDAQLGEKLVEGIQKHIVNMAEHQAKLKKDLEDEEEEAKRKITSDDMHEGFESHVCFYTCHTTRQSLNVSCSMCLPNQRHPRSRAQKSNLPRLRQNLRF